MTPLFTCPYCQQQFAAGPTVAEQMQYPRWDPRNQSPVCPHCGAQLSWRWNPSAHPNFDIWMQGCAGALLALSNHLSKSPWGDVPQSWLTSWPAYLGVMLLLALVVAPYLAMCAGWLFPQQFARLGRFTQKDPNVVREGGQWLYPLIMVTMCWCMLLADKDPPRFMSLVYLAVTLFTPLTKTWAGVATYVAVGAVLWLCPALLRPWVGGVLLLGVSAASVVSIAWFVQLFRPQPADE